MNTNEGPSQPYPDMFRTTANWLSNEGIPPIVFVVVVIFVSVQLIIIALLLLRCVIKKMYHSPYDDYEKLGADHFLVDKMETSTQKRTRKGERGSFSDSRRSTSEPTLRTTSEVLAEPPTPSLRQYTPQPGSQTRTSGRKPRTSTSARRGVSMKEETVAAKKRNLFAGTRSQSIPQNMFRASIESSRQQSHVAEIGKRATPQVAGVPTSQFGKISFAVTYDRQLEQIKIFLEQARQLAVRTQKVFELGEFSHKDSIGELEYPLSQHPDLEIPVMIWRDLQAPSKVVTPNKGELLFSLTYLPNAEKLTVIVLKARNLGIPNWGRQTMGKNAMDTFVKVSMVKASKVMKVKQTRICRKSCNPVYNEGFSLKLKQSDLDEASITLSVCLRLNNLGFHRVIGRCIVGRHAGADGVSHWRDMINTPRSGVGQWHAIL